MNPSITTEFAMPDPGANPLNLIQLFSLANVLVHSELDGDSFNTYVLQNGTPNVDDQDKVWFEVSSTGQPVAIKVFYNGSWRRIYNGMLGEIRGYTGTPTDHFDTTGKGKINELYDGWALCNGKNGTPDLSDSFLIGAHMNNTGGHTGYNKDKGGWTTYVSKKDDEHTGGVKDHMIVNSELPPWDPNAVDLDGNLIGSRSDVTIKGHEYKDLADSEEHTDPQIIVDVNYANLKPHQVTINHYGANPSGHPPDPQVAMPVLPPFLALAWITFIGYT